MPYTIQIWHAKVPTFRHLASRPTLFSLNYVCVETLTVEADSVLSALEEVFSKSQNIELAWKLPNRSTSVGDILIVDADAWYSVDNIGFSLLLE